MLLPVLPVLIPPGLAIFTRLVQLVPSLFAVLLKVASRLLPLIGPLVPGLTSRVHALLPLLVPILGAFLPVCALLRALRPVPARLMCESRPISAQIVASSGYRASQRAACRSPPGNSEEIIQIASGWSFSRTRTIAGSRSPRNGLRNALAGAIASRTLSGPRAGR